MTDEEFMSKAFGEIFGCYDSEDDVFSAIDREHEKDAPTMSARLKRTFPTYSERLIITGHPQVRSIMVAAPAIPRDGAPDLPPTVRTLPVGWRDMASAERFRARFETVVGTYENMGWVRT